MNRRAVALFFSASVAALIAQQQNWVQRFPSHSPSERWQSGFAFHAARNQIVLFGGGSPSGPGYSTDTWVWDGTDWIQLFPANNPNGINGPMAYDAARGEVVLVGGTAGNETWIWDGATWTRKFPVTSPPARGAFAMAYDAARAQVVMFGGAAPGLPLSDTWVWDGANWQQKFPTNSPPKRYVHAMVYDAARAQVVLFGGYDDRIVRSYNDTWVWDGSNWTQKSPAHSPSPRENQAMAYDAARGQVVLFGGYYYGYREDTWVWDGNDWSQMFPASSPPSRCCAAMAYDPRRGEVVLFGGNRGTGFNDTWVWTSAPSGTISVTTNLPAATFTISGPAIFTGTGQSATFSNAPAGSYTITYGSVPQYLRACQ